MNPDFLAMQIRAMIKAAIDVKTELKPVNLEILVPMLTSEHELDSIIKNINATVYEVFDAEGATVEYRIGAVIETPRACLCANKIARTEGLSFVVFGLDRLTELTCGLSRADTEAMISTYNVKGIIHKDPFCALDTHGVGVLLTAGVNLVRKGAASMPIGVFGCQCGHKKTVNYFDKLNLDFIISSISHLPAVKICCAQAYITSMKEFKQTWIEESQEDFQEDFAAHPFLI